MKEIGSSGWTIHEFKHESMTKVLIFEVIDACKFQDYDIEMLEMLLLWFEFSLRLWLPKLWLLLRIFDAFWGVQEDVFFGESRRLFSCGTTMISDEIRLGRSLECLVKHSSKS